MAKAEDPPSPVDAYVAPPIPTPAGGTQPPPPPAPGYAQAPYGQPGYVQPGYAPVRPTNILAIIGLIASGVGFIIPGAMLGGIIMGHIALSQIKRTGENGHGLALAAVIVGYAVLGIYLVVIVIYVLIIVLAVGTVGTSFNQFNPNDFG